MLFIIVFSGISLRETCPTNTSLEFASKLYQRRILSPNYPYRYFLADSNCSWLIQSNLLNGPGYIIEVVINDFSLGGSENSLSFYDGVSPTTSRLLGTYRRSYSPDHGVFTALDPFCISSSRSYKNLDGGPMATGGGTSMIMIAVALTSVFWQSKKV